MEDQKIIGFADFLSRSPKSFNEIAQFLVMNTLDLDEVFCLYIGEVIESGNICHVGSFGWTKAEFDSFRDIAIQANFPICESLKSHKVLSYLNNEGFFEEYPDMKNTSYKGPWLSGISIPLGSLGVIAYYSSLEISLDKSKLAFLSAIGSLLCLYMSMLTLSLAEQANKVKEVIDIPMIPLTNRQFVIAGMLERGFTNIEIALEIGYSESLVRQETVAIYRNLQVTGRQAMQAIRTLHLESQENMEQSI